MRFKLANRARVIVVAALLLMFTTTTQTAKANPICPADWDENGYLSAQDIFDFLNDWFAGAGDFNLDGALNSQDIFDFLAAWFAGCPTTLDLSVGPNAGELGSLISVAVPSAPNTATFNSSNTVIVWSGRYVPAAGGGAPTSPFSVTWTYGVFAIVEQHVAQVRLGSGVYQNVPDIGLRGSTGTLQGTISVIFSDGTIASKPFVFAPATNAARWRTLVYSEPFYTGAPPDIGPEPSALRVYPLSATPDPTQPTFEQLAGATGAHHVVQALVERNAQTEEISPNAPYFVDVFSITASGAVYDPGWTHVPLYRDLSDNDPDHIVLTQPREFPFVIVDTVPDDYLIYFPMALIATPSNGKIIVSPSLY